MTTREEAPSSMQEGSWRGETKAVVRAGCRSPIVRGASAAATAPAFDRRPPSHYRFLVSDDLFPSGPWIGFYNYRPQDKHRMDLQLTFADGKLTGEGNDDVGRFVVKGQYDRAARECWWTKTYPGSQDVFYRGFREGKGIWRNWEIGVIDHCGFRFLAQSRPAKTSRSKKS